ncbi:MAG: GTPase HflX, partial [Devosiaceae bacterium]|nr:GTPase HflX [Devosiaceae bacterium]
GADLLVFDFELSASQVRNIKKLTEIETLDRCQIILEIFARHARTKEAKIQIEISKLEYMLPRLSSLWTHFSRQKGGIGVRGGEGEQQIELDRRIVRDRISKLKQNLK